MVKIGKKSHPSSSTPVKSRVSKGDTGITLSTLLKNKSGSNTSQTKRRKSKVRSHVGTLGSVLSKRKTPEISTKSSNNSLNGRSIRRKLSEEGPESDTEKPLSVIFQSIKSSTGCNKLPGKSTDEQANTVDRKKRRKRRKKREKEEKEELDEPSRFQRRTRYLLIKIKLEQNLIDAYSGEGWNGQSREKIKPEKELQRATKQILKCKLGIRDAIRKLESLSSEACIKDSTIDPDGSVFHEHIFCSKCKLREAFPDNNIILCDGTCRCSFHQKCLDPPLSNEDLPPNDEGRYCNFCECKMEILEAVNAHLGTQFPPESHWQDIFEEEADQPDCANWLDPEEEWPSDESDDADYFPERYDKSCIIGKANNEEEMSGYASSSSWTAEEETSMQSGRLANDKTLNGKSYSHKFRSGKYDDINMYSDDTTDLITDNRRRRRDVDYKKLYDEMFGKDIIEQEHVTDDEDWGPGRRRKGRGDELDATGFKVNLRGNGLTGKDVVPMEDNKKLSLASPRKRYSVASPERKPSLASPKKESSLASSKKKPSSVSSKRKLSSSSSKKKLSSASSKKKPTYVSHARRSIFRIPQPALQKFRAVFAENELPRRAVRLSLSKQFGISFEKVNKWFKNTRYAALKIRKAEEGTNIENANEPSAKTERIHNFSRVTPDLKPKIPTLVTAAPLSKNLKKKRRKKPKPLTMQASKKKRHKSAAAASPNKINQVRTSSRIGIDLKKGTTNLQKEKKKANSTSKTKTYTDAEKQLIYHCEMERLSRLQDKLDNLKKTISRLQNDDNLNPNPENVVYVPVAELKEKI